MMIVKLLREKKTTLMIPQISCEKFKTINSIILRILSSVFGFDVRK